MHCAPSHASTPGLSYAVFGRMAFDRVRHVWHHVAQRLSHRNPVVYVRDPVRPSWRQVWHRTGTNEEGLREVTPLDFPLQRVPAIRRACERSAGLSIVKALGTRDRPLVGILYPRSAISVANACRPELLVYHATDDFSLSWGGQTDHAFLAWEKEALSHSQLVIAVAESLAERLRETGHRRVVLLPNGFDEVNFDGTQRTTPKDIERLPRPIIGYAGSVYPSKLDIELLAEAASARPGWSFALVGEIFEEHSDPIASLRRLPNVHLLGLRSFAEVPAYVGSFDVAMNPHRVDRVGREVAFYPLKAYDALAMGRPVVLTPGSRLDSLAPHVVFTSGLSQFLAAIENALDSSRLPEASRARMAAAAPHSWSARVQSFEEHVLEAMAIEGPR